MANQRLGVSCGLGVAALGAVLLALTACASRPGPPGSAATSSAAAPAPKLSVSKFPRPEGFDQPATLVGDPTGSGAYFLAESRTDARVFHWDGQNLTSWSVGDPSTDTDLVTGIQNSIAAGSDGTVWVGVNNTLIELNTATGKSSMTTMPAATDSAAAEKLRPADIQGYHPIIGLAVAPNGDLAVIRDAALDVQVRDHTSGKFGQVVASSSTEPASIAYDQSGTLAIDSYVVGAIADLSKGTLQLLKPGASSTIPGGNTQGGNLMSRPGGGFILVPSAPTFSAVSVAADGVQTPLPPIAPKAQLAVEGPSALASASVVAVGTTAGVALFDTVSGTEQDLNFPTFTCDYSNVPVPGGTMPAPTPTNTVCGTRALALSVDTTGTIWSVTSGSDSEIAQIQG
jgi:hypothetical protein